MRIHGYFFHDGDAVPFVPPPEFFDWLLATHEPTWLQPLDEPLGSTATAGMAGPNSSSVTSVTFGEPGLVESDRTAALFNTSRIVFPKGAVTDRMHQAEGGTIMFWARPDASFSGELYTVLSTNQGSSLNVGVLIGFEDRSTFDMTVRVTLSHASGSSEVIVFQNYSGSDGVAGATAVISSPGVITPGNMHHIAVSHSSSSNMIIYVNGAVVANVARSSTHSSATSTINPTIGSASVSTSSAPFKGLLQGLTFIPSVLNPAQISEIYTRSGGPFT